MEIHLLQFVPWLGILGDCTPSSTPSSDAGINYKIKLTRYRPEKRRSSCINHWVLVWMRWLLQVLIGQRMGQDFKKKKMLLSNTCANHIRLWVFFFILLLLLLLFFNRDGVSGWHAQLPMVMLFAANMAAMCARAERSNTHHVSAPILAPVRARMNDSSMCACVLSSLSSLLPDSINSNSAPPDVLLCSPTPWCYISHVVWSVCGVRPAWAWQCHTAADMLWLCACILSLLWKISD